MLSTSAATGQSGAPEEETRQAAVQQMGISADDTYRVWQVTHHGDNRGNPWYSDEITRPVDPTKQTPSVK